MSYRFAALWVAAWGALQPGATATQEGCPIPRELLESPARRLFTPEQEAILGAAMARSFERDFPSIGDPELLERLEAIRDRLARPLPEDWTRPEVLLLDVPVPNAFVIPGRIYVTRKLVGLSRREDELAGVLAHEIAHAARGEPEEQLSALVQEVLGIDRVEPDEDVNAVLSRLADVLADRADFEAEPKEHLESQITADRLGLYLVALAGYDTSAAIGFWDRIARTEGKTGNWLSDLFGATRPESRRLREMRNQVRAMPPECRSERAAAATQSDYLRWHSAVMRFSGPALAEELEGVLSHSALDHPLRSEVKHLRFSPDGSHLLAQDESSVFVLSVDPLSTRFRVDAVDARPARFDPDSREVLVYYPSLRVERFSIERRELAAAFELHIPEGCLQLELSADGGVLACLAGNGDLLLADVATGEELFRKKLFYRAPAEFILLQALLNAIERAERDWIQMAFSPDGRYFVAGVGARSAAWDVEAKEELSVPRSVRPLLGLSFTFLGSDRLLGVHRRDPKRSALVAFPSGEVLADFPMGRQRISAPASGDYVLVRPVPDHPVGVVDLSSRRLVLANRDPAFDIHGDLYASQLSTGELGLYRRRASAKSYVPEAVHKVVLTGSPLGRLRAAAVSPRLNWLALSERLRGGIWDLESGGRVFRTPGFQGAWFDPDGNLLADFGELDGMERRIQVLDPRSGRIVDAARPRSSTGMLLFGQRMVELEALDEGRSGEIVLAMRDLENLDRSWSMTLAPSIRRVYLYPPGTIILEWKADERPARRTIQETPGLNARWDTLRRKERGRLLERLDPATGEVTGRLLVEVSSPSALLERVVAAGDTIAVSDLANRVRIYSQETGERRGTVFGNGPVLSPSGKLVCVETRRGELMVHELGSLAARKRFAFSSPVALAGFGVDEKRLLVVTVDQTVFSLDVSFPGEPESARDAMMKDLTPEVSARRSRP